MTCFRLIAVVLLAGVAAACGRLNQIEGLNTSGLTEASSDIARTFDNAYVALPGQRGEPPLIGRMDDDDVAERVAGLAGRTPLPAVVYLHGCTGLHNETPLRTLAAQGFAVIAPDSFARRFRPLQCRPSNKTGGENRFVFDFRLTEVSYALHRIERLGWIDMNQLFLLGVSEGAVAAALYRGDQFRGRVITQWTCQGNVFVRGVAAPPDEPVLAVVRAGDPWYDQEQTRAQSGDCGPFIESRPNSQSIVIDSVPGHDVLDQPSTMMRIVEFLRTLTAPRSSSATTK